MSRPETGPMEFADDWRGVFIRGDEAMMRYVPALRRLLDRMATSAATDNSFEDLLSLSALEALYQLLMSANQFNPSDSPVQEMKPFDQCVK